MKAVDVKVITHRRLLALAHSMASKRVCVDFVTEHGGPSESWTRKFMNKEITNPTVDRLDRLIAALDDIDKIIRAAA